MEHATKQVRLAARPVGMPKESDFVIAEERLAPPGDGQVLVRIVYLSVDPYMRGLMREGGTYAAGVGLNQVMYGGTVGQVEESRHPGFRAGEYVEGNLGWQTYALSDGSGLRKVDPAIAPLSTALGALGMPGLTAYFGMTEIARAKGEDTIVVSGAAGAVGSIAGQIGKILGCRVVGTAGSDEKVRWITEDLGFDAGFNYRNTRDLRGELERLCPNGIDVYFDNVGGAMLDAVLMRINKRARIALCGAISQYNNTRPEMGPRLLFNLIVKQARMEGFLVFQFAERYPEALRQMTEWVRQGRLKYREHFTDGIESAPRAFIRMLQGENIGKQLVRVSAE